MPLPNDIIERVERDFGINADAVLMKCEQLSAQLPQVFNDRVLRCIIFAASGEIARFKHLVEAAQLDVRDVIVAGECDENWQTVRDFTKPFSN